jgi:hypothetical protein
VAIRRQQRERQRLDFARVARTGTGNAPPDYAYLDDAQVALYLGQLEGGIAQSEQLTQQLTQNRSAGVSAGGLSLGGSTGSAASAERVVTPTATARFYQLLDLLGRDRYIHTIDAAASPAALRSAFAAVPEGSFVELKNCSIELPSYVRLEQLSRSSTGIPTELGLYLAAEHSRIQAGSYHTWGDELQAALAAAGRLKGGVGNGTTIDSVQTERGLRRAIRTLDKAGRVPLSTCDAKTDYRPHGVDLLFPIHLADLSSEPSLLAGPVTLVGKLVRAVRKPGQEYVDDGSFAAFGAATDRIESLTGGQPGMWDELDADAVVLAPGAVILPIAIYK